MNFRLIVRKSRVYPEVNKTCSFAGSLIILKIEIVVDKTFFSVILKVYFLSLNYRKV